MCIEVTNGFLASVVISSLHLFKLFIQLYIQTTTYRSIVRQVVADRLRFNAQTPQCSRKWYDYCRGTGDKTPLMVSRAEPKQVSIRTNHPRRLLPCVPNRIQCPYPDCNLSNKINKILL